MTRCYLALGSNLEHPARQLQQAVAALKRSTAVHLKRCSSIYRSQALGGPGGQPDYFNAVVAIDTALSPLPLLDLLQAIESAQGRVRSEHWGPRTLDIDILLYGAQSIAEPRLTVPHPQMTRRNFVLVPLAEICDPQYTLPDGQHLASHLAACPPGDLERTAISLNPE